MYVCKYLCISMYYTLLTSNAVTAAQLDDKDYEGSRSKGRARYHAVSQALTVLCDWVIMWMHICDA